MHVSSLHGMTNAFINCIYLHPWRCFMGPHVKLNVARRHPILRRINRVIIVPTINLPTILQFIQHIICFVCEHARWMKQKVS